MADPFLTELWYDLAGAELPPAVRVPDFETLRRTQWVPEFEQLMRNRLIMGAFRYGLIEKQDWTKHDLIAYTKNRISEYEKTDNLEMLVDAANLLLLEFRKYRNSKPFIAKDRSD